MTQDYTPVARSRRPRRPWTEEEAEKAKRLRAEGLSCEKIGVLLDRAGCSVYAKLNPEKYRERARRKYWQDPEKARENARRWQKENPEKSREAHRRWRELNADRKLETDRLWREQNREKVREAQRRWAENNPEKAREARRRWEKENPEKAKAKRQRSFQRNREALKERQRRAYWKNPEKFRKRAVHWAKANPETVNASARKRYRRAPEKIREYNRRRHALRRHRSETAMVKVTLAIKNKRFALFADTCAYCDSKEGITVDHVLAIAYGGLDEPDNIIPACRPCNCSKKASPVEAWYRSQPFFSEARWELIKQHCPSATGQLSLALPT
jgi:hypothetical protein